MLSGMGSSAQALARVAAVSALVLGVVPPALAQVPAAPPVRSAEPVPPPPPAGQPTAEADDAIPPPPAPPPQAAPPAPPPGPAAPAAAPALDPPPPVEPPTRPPFLRTREEADRIERDRAERERAAEPTPRKRQSSPDFVRRSSPWVDFALTSYYLDDRVDNFWNFGFQAGAYLFEHLRVSARLVAPLDEVSDSAPYYGYGGGDLIDSRSIAVLYGASVGVVVSNSRSFVFGPSLALLRTDVEAYGSAWFVTLPFEWTTQRNLRVGFELGLGHAFGGEVRRRCVRNGVPCGIQEVERQGGTALLGQFYMGWNLGRL